MPAVKNKSVGAAGEELAAKLLEDKDYKILDRNFSGRFGEIDIIAKKKGVFYFIEVKTRRSMKFGFPSEAITKEKLRRFKKTVEYYAKLNDLFKYPLRILVATVDKESDEIDLIEVE